MWVDGVANIIRSMVYKGYIKIYAKNYQQITTHVAAQSVLKGSKKRESKRRSRNSTRKPIGRSPTSEKVFHKETIKNGTKTVTNPLFRFHPVSRC